jgi:membrane protein DedA with SNARE-associated domain
MYETIISFIVNSIGALGYIGIFFLMFLESSFFFFPSEVVIIPAGYLAFQGKMDISLIVLFGVLGSLAGAWLNYFIANKFGRKFLLKFLKEKHLKTVESFFEKHGPISTFNGRLIPVVRQYISFPAGFAKMDSFKFTFYTGIGSIIWTLILVFLGYFIGQNKELIGIYLNEIIILVLVALTAFTLMYVYIKRGRKK